MNDFMGDRVNDPVADALKLLDKDADNSDELQLDPAVIAAADTVTEAVEEEEEAFNYDGYQVVRREFFAHINEPSITFNNCKIGVNRACVCKLPDIDYVQILVNPDTKKLAIRPCNEGERDAFLWCNNSNNKKKPKQITCKLFFAMVVQLMGWNPDYRYKMLGKLIRANDEYLFVFDLSAVEIYQRTFPDGAKPKTAKVPVFPSEWKGQFGLPFDEHRKSLQINIFDGYAVYEIKDNTTSKTQDETNSDAKTTLPTDSLPEKTES